MSQLVQPLIAAARSDRPFVWTHGHLHVNGVRLHYVEMGQGPPVVLLHGFPEFWYSWRRQLPALAAAGFRAIALDLRGYNESSQPVGVERYRTAVLVEDVAGFIENLGDAACVVGHDWGGVVAWRLAALRPELVRKLAVLNAPHPAAFRVELRRHPGQWLRSAYMLFFQLPWLPELLLTAGGLMLFKRMWRRQPVHAGTYTEQDLAHYQQAFANPAALTGPLNFYRAAARHPADLYALPQVVPVPTLLIWGERDTYLGVGLTEGLDRWVPNLRVERIAGASHWVQNDVPEQVNGLLADFFAEQRVR